MAPRGIKLFEFQLTDTTLKTTIPDGIVVNI